MGRKPGRKPVGEVAMSGAERMRRHRERYGKPGKAAGERDRLQAQITALEAEVARLKRTSTAKATSAAKDAPAAADWQPERARLLARIKALEGDLVAKQLDDAAIAEHKRRLDGQFEQRLKAAVRTVLKGMPPRQRVALIGLGSDKDHKLIESVLHSDSRKNTTPEKLDSAFIAYHQRIKPTLEGLRKQIELAEKAEARKYKEARQHDETSERRRLEEWVSRPRTPEEWDERKRQVSEERAAKRAAKKA